MKSENAQRTSHFEKVLRQARVCLRRGWSVVPIPKGRKAPQTKGWNQLRLEADELEDAFSGSDNIGLILGNASGGLVDVDLDCSEAISVSSTFLPLTERIHGHEGSPGSHWWYLCRETPHPMQFCDIDNTILIELRSNGQQTLIPPSFHPNGDILTWKLARDPALVDTQDLQVAIRRLAACVLVTRHWPKAGQRHECSKALAGVLLRSGWAEEQVMKFITEAAKQSLRDEEWEERKSDIRTTVKRLAESRPATGIPRLAEILGDQVVGKLSEWLEFPSDSRARSAIVDSSPSDHVQWPDALRQEALYGLAGEIVSVIEPNSEADPVALLSQSLVSFGNAIGRTSYFKVESDKHFTNLFIVLVGETSKARKGLSWGHISNLFKHASPDWADSCIQSGLSTGEGLIWAVRNPILRQEPKREGMHVVEGKPVILDEGVDDKRLLGLEAEYAQLLKLMSREANILSAVIRQAWDSGNLRILTKTSPGKATGAHISIIGHITQDELRRYLSETEQANGFANRFQWFSVRRSKCLPEGGHVDDQEIANLVQKLKKAIHYAGTVEEMTRDTQAKALWYEIYSELSEGKPGMLGALTSRAEAQVTRLSMVYALMDCSAVIRREHLEAALAVWKYVEDSARFIFGDALGDPLADEILMSLRKSANGMTRTEISNLFQRHKSSGEIGRALLVLARSGQAVSHQEQTMGRPDERWCALSAGAKNAKKDGR